jgi:hypothetical protein
VANFVICSEWPLEKNQSAIAQLPQLQTRVLQTLELSAERREWIQVYLFSSPASLERYVQRYFPEAPKRPALFIKRRGPGMVFACHGPQLARDLRHEVTHAILHAHLPMVPLWLDEGIAKYFEQPEPGNTGTRPQSAIPGTVASLERLEQLTDLQQMGRAEYTQARQWVSGLLHASSGSRQILLEYLHDLRRHQVPTPLSVTLREQGLPDTRPAIGAHPIR